MRGSRTSKLLSYGTLIILSGALVWGQTLPSSGMQPQQIINIPGWRATGSAGNANTDLFGFNPVTRMMYLADRTNHAVTVIDTHANVVVSRITLPVGTTVNVPIVAVELQQLAVSDGLQSVYVFDLRAPQPQPDIYTFPTSRGGVTDAIDYDPINETMYVVTDTPPEYLIGINLAYKQVVAEIPLPASSDLIKFNPVDGKIYIAAEDADGSNASAAAGLYVYDPATGPNGQVTLLTKIGPACPGHGIDIDPISNVAVMGCFGPPLGKGDVAISLKDGTLLKTFNVGGTDTIVFNPNIRRFYAGAGLNAVALNNCPSPPKSPFFGTLVPVVGVFDATGANGAATEYAPACSGAGNHIAGVDPITNTVYVPVGQYPPDPNSTTTGQNGVLVFKDTTPPAQAPVTSAQAVLTPVGSSAAAGTVQFTLVGRRMHVSGTPTGITGNAAWLVVPTTVTTEFLACAVNKAGSNAVCGEDMLGDPLIGSVATLSVDGVAAARGPIATH